MCEMKEMVLGYKHLTAKFQYLSPAKFQYLSPLTSSLYELWTGRIVKCGKGIQQAAEASSLSSLFKVSLKKRSVLFCLEKKVEIAKSKLAIYKKLLLFIKLITLIRE